MHTHHHLHNPHNPSCSRVLCGAPAYETSRWREQTCACSASWRGVTPDGVSEWVPGQKGYSTARSRAWQPHRGVRLLLPDPNLSRREEALSTGLRGSHTHWHGEILVLQNGSVKHNGTTALFQTSRTVLHFQACLCFQFGGRPHKNVALKYFPSSKTLRWIFEWCETQMNNSHTVNLSTQTWLVRDVYIFLHSIAKHETFKAYFIAKFYNHLAYRSFV